MSYHSSKFPEIKLDSKSCEDLITALTPQDSNDDKQRSKGEVLFVSSENFEHAARQINTVARAIGKWL